MENKKNIIKSKDLENRNGLVQCGAFIGVVTSVPKYFKIALEAVIKEMKKDEEIERKKIQEEKENRIEKVLQNFYTFKKEDVVCDCVLENISKEAKEELKEYYTSFLQEEDFNYKNSKGEKTDKRLHYKLYLMTYSNKFLEIIEKYNIELIDIEYIYTKKIYLDILDILYPDSKGRDVALIEKFKRENRMPNCKSCKDIIDKGKGSDFIQFICKEKNIWGEIRTIINDKILLTNK